MNSLSMRMALILGLVLSTAACQQATPPPEALRPVLTRVIGKTAATESLTYSGEVRSRIETALAFRIPGKIAQRLVDTGARVKAGDVLARLDPSDTALTTASAQAQLDLAEAEARRYRELQQRNFVSQAALDAKETARKSARAQLDLARNQGSYTELRADQAGVISQVSAEAGQVVAAGQAVMRLARTDALEVAVSIPESAITEVRSLGKAVVKLWADDQAVFSGYLREVSPIADPATRTYAARVAIDNPDSAVLLGMTATVCFKKSPSAAGERLVVPLTSIFQQAGEPAVWVVAPDETLSLRPVTVASFGETEAVLERGLKAGERIVIAGVHKLAAGEKIRPVDHADGARP